MTTKLPPVDMTGYVQPELEAPAPGEDDWLDQASACSIEDPECEACQ